MNRWAVDPEAASWEIKHNASEVLKMRVCLCLRGGSVRILEAKRIEIVLGLWCRRGGRTKGGLLMVERWWSLAAKMS